MKASKWVLFVILFTFLSLAILISCDKEDDDDDDDDTVPADDDDDDAADDDDAEDDDADVDDDDAAADDDSGDASGACCSCAGDYAPAPDGEETKLLTLRARKLFMENPELRETAHDLLIRQDLIRHIPDEYKPMVLRALDVKSIDPAVEDSTMPFVRLYECGFELEDVDGFVMNLEEAVADNNVCVSGCFGLVEAAACEDLAECVGLCLAE